MITVNGSLTIENAKTKQQVSINGEDFDVDPHFTGGGYTIDVELEGISIEKIITKTEEVISTEADWDISDEDWSVIENKITVT